MARKHSKRNPRGEIQVKGQSPRASAAEALLNILIGFWISVLTNVLLLPLWGYQVSVTQGVEIGLAFTLVSFLRSFALRRLFNYLALRA